MKTLCSHTSNLEKLIGNYCQNIYEKVLDAATPPGAEVVYRKDLRKAGLTTPITCFYLSAFVGIFTFFFITGYYSSVNTKFLSPIDADNSGQVCATVPVELTGTYRIDKNGNWQGQSGFQSYEAVYELELLSASLYPSKYQAIMQTFKDQMIELRKRALKRDYAWNLMAWTAFSLQYIGSGEVGDKGTVNFYSAGSAEMIYDNVVEKVGIVNADGDLCYKDGMAAFFDYSRKALTVSIPIEKVSSTSSLSVNQKVLQPCPTIFNLQEDLGYGSSISTDYVEIQFDVRSINTAIAVNFGITPLNSLELVSAMSEIFNLPLESPNSVSMYKDSFYPDMIPIVCGYLNKSFVRYAYGIHDNVPEMGPGCFVSSGNKLYYPIIQHSGKDFSYKQQKYCWTVRDQCSPTADAYITNDDYYVDYMRQCDDMDILVGLLYIPGNTSSSTAPLGGAIQHGVTFGKDGDIELLKKAFPLMQRSVDAYEMFSYGAEAYMNGSVATWYYFFKYVSENCPETYRVGISEGFAELTKIWNITSPSMITFQIKKKYVGLQTYIPGTILNSDYLSVVNISYSDGFYAPKALDAMIANPPMSLIEKFLVCHMDARNAFLNAAGISLSNTEMLVALGLMLCFIFLRTIWKKLLRSPTLVSKETKDEMYRMMLYVMLRALHNGEEGKSLKFKLLLNSMKSFDEDCDDNLTIDEVIGQLRKMRMIQGELGQTEDIKDVELSAVYSATHEDHTDNNSVIHGNHP